MAGYIDGAIKLAEMIDVGLSEPFNSLIDIKKDANSDIVTEGATEEIANQVLGTATVEGDGTGIYTMLDGESVKLDSVEGGMKMGFHNDKVAKEGDVLTGVISNKKAIDQKVARTQG